MVPHPPIPSIAGLSTCHPDELGNATEQEAEYHRDQAPRRRSREIQLGCRAKHEDQYERPLVHMQGEPRGTQNAAVRGGRPSRQRRRAEPGEQHHVDRGTFGVAPDADCIRRVERDLARRESAVATTIRRVMIAVQRTW